MASRRLGLSSIRRSGVDSRWLRIRSSRAVSVGAKKERWGGGWGRAGARVPCRSVRGLFGGGTRGRSGKASSASADAATGVGGAEDTEGTGSGAGGRKLVKARRPGRSPGSGAEPVASDRSGPPRCSLWSRPRGFLDSPRIVFIAALVWSRSRGVAEDLPACGAFFGVFLWLWILSKIPLVSMC